MPSTTNADYGTEAVHQDGNRALGGTFADSGSLLDNSASEGGRIGIIFDFSSVLDLTGTIFDLNQVTLRVEDSNTIDNVTVVLYLVPETNPADYSDSLLPGGRSEVADENIICRANGDLNTGDLTWQDGQDFTFILGSDFTDGSWSESSSFTQNLHNLWARYLRRSDWEGRVALSFVSESIGGAPGPIARVQQGPSFTSSEGSATLGPRVQIRQWSVNTGHEASGHRRSKAQYCPRSGRPVATENLVEDGYLEGLWVHPEEWEPEDRVHESLEPSESERDDSGKWGLDQ